MDVTIRKQSMVPPLEPTPQRILWNSNVDLVIPRIHTKSVYFYNNVGGIADNFNHEKLAEALGKALVPFYPMAGRLKRGEGGRIEINCNALGVLLVEAEANVAIADFGEFAPHPSFLRLVPQVDYSQDISSFPLLVLQITYFDCGGVSLGVGMQHHVADGTSGIHCINTWSEMARGIPLKTHPFIDRTLLKANSPPAPLFSHIEYQAPPRLLKLEIADCFENGNGAVKGDSYMSRNGSVAANGARNGIHALSEKTNSNHVGNGSCKGCHVRNGNSNGSRIGNGRGNNNNVENGKSNGNRVDNAESNHGSHCENGKSNGSHIENGESNGSHIGNGKSNRIHFENGKSNGGNVVNGRCNGSHFANGECNGSHVENGKSTGGYFANGDSNGNHVENGRSNGSHVASGKSNGSHVENGPRNGFSSGNSNGVTDEVHHEIGNYNGQQKGSQLKLACAINSLNEEDIPTAMRVFKFNLKQISTLKQMAVEAKTDVTFSSYEMLSGHIWKCVTQSRNLQHSQETKLFIATDGRSRLVPTLPKGYFGNVIFTCTPIVTAGELVSNPVTYAARKIHEALARMNDEYLRSALDYLEVQDDVSELVRGARHFNSPNLGITSWARMPVYECDFGSGRPIHMGPCSIAYEGLAYVLASPVNDGSLSLNLCLRADHMAAFANLVTNI